MFIIRSYLETSAWGPHYWFVLYSIAITYPNTPNNVTKKKYYEFIQNLPLFLPHDEISNYFSNMLIKYPVTPYLDSRDSFTRWIHFIHNQVNIRLNKPLLSYKEYIKLYTYKPILHISKRTVNYTGIILVCILLVIIFSKNSI